MAFRLDDISINTIVGDGSSVVGNLRVNGFVRVDGDLDGNLETDGNVIIGGKARIRGDITANSVTVGGIVLGSITAKENIKLLSSSAVVGDVIARHVVVDDNVVLEGYCISESDSEKFERESESFLQAKAIRARAHLS